MALGKYGPTTFSFRPADAEVYDLRGNRVTTYSDSTGATAAPPSINARGQVYFWVEAGTYDLLLSTAGDSGTVTQSIIVAPGGVDEPNPNAASGALSGDGPPTNPTNADASVTGAANTSGTFTLTFRGQTTAPIAWNATSADIAVALAALSTVGAGNVAPYPGYETTTVNDVSFVVWTNVLGGQVVENLTVTNDTTDHGVTAGSDQTGAAGTPDTAIFGSRYTDNSTRRIYELRGSPDSPAWKLAVDNVVDPVLHNGSTFTCQVLDTGVAFGLKRSGDDFPWVLLAADGYLYLGDGTFDPHASGISVYTAGGFLRVGDLTAGAFASNPPGLDSNVFVFDLANGFFVGNTAGSPGVPVHFEGTPLSFKLTGLPTVDPGVAGELWNNAGTVKISAGP